MEDQERAVQRIVRGSGKIHTVDVETDPQAALARLGDDAYDLLIVSLNLAGADGLRLCSQVRSLERTRHLPIIVVVEPADEQRLLRALDMGVNDYLMRPVDRNELLARVRTQIRRKRHSDYLRDSLNESLELAVTDPLTGLFNRRYLETHAKRSSSRRALQAARCRCWSPTSITSSRSTTRTATMPATACCASSPSACAATRAASTSYAASAARNSSSSCRTRRCGARGRSGSVCARALPASRSGSARPPQVAVTASVGLATLEAAGEGMDALFNRADLALYAAKREGRNRVVADAA